MHIDTLFPLGLPEARQRWFTYPPPYKQGQQYYYVTPWLWIDGDKHGTYAYSTWGTKIAERLLIPSPVTITMWGDYNPGTFTGTVYAQFRNDSTAALTGRVLFVLTEDSLNFVGPNGDAWHNQVARDYVPDHIGELVTIPAGDSLTANQPFTLDPSWNANRMRIITFIQDTVMQVDTTIEIWQGGMIDLAELGILEYGGTGVLRTDITAAPNPCINNARFTFTLPAEARYQITFFDVSGRTIRGLTGTATGNQESVAWNLKDNSGMRVSSGVYLYRFESAGTLATGKVVVR